LKDVSGWSSTLKKIENYNFLNDRVTNIELTLNQTVTSMAPKNIAEEAVPHAMQDNSDRLVKEKQNTMLQVRIINLKTTFTDHYLCIAFC
jgi:hypothetical protein